MGGVGKVADHSGHGWEDGPDQGGGKAKDGGAESKKQGGMFVLAR